MTIAENLQAISEKIERAAQRSGRSSANITLVAVTKTVQVDQVNEAIAAGATHFGENRVQEALERYSLPGAREPDKVDRTGITLHMIGTLQRNKARRAAAFFDWVQSVDRVELLPNLEDGASARVSGRESLPIMIEVNLTAETSKSGVAKEEVAALADALAGCHHLHGAGLMTIARQNASEAELRDTFSALRTLAENLRALYPGHWQHLSMGMSDDYEIAIEEGTTIVRIGRAIFGARG